MGRLYLGYSGRSSVINHKGPSKGRQENPRMKKMCWWTQRLEMCFEDGEGPTRQGMSLEAWKAKRKDSLLESPEKKASRVHSEFSLVRPFFGLLTSRTVRQ